MNLLKSASEILAEVRKNYASEQVCYTPLGGNSFTVPAALGSTLFRIDDISGMTTRTRSTDFIINKNELNITPRKGDQISYTGNIYEVLAPNNEPVWRWSGNSMNTYRIHAKLIDDGGDYGY
ncbi:MAG: hypothetical protein RR415_10960 [Ruthenibacterium sp.]